MRFIQNPRTNQFVRFAGGGARGGGITEAIIETVRIGLSALRRVTCLWRRREGSVGKFQRKKTVRGDRRG